MPANTVQLECGKVYCIGVHRDNEKPVDKKIVRYNGPDTPWEDICTGKPTVLDDAVIDEAIEVPPIVVEAIKLAQDKRPLPTDLPRNECPHEQDSWEADVYWDD
jgi:hypothetical protein